MDVKEGGNRKFKTQKANIKPLGLRLVDLWQEMVYAGSDFWFTARLSDCNNSILCWRMEQSNVAAIEIYSMRVDHCHSGFRARQPADRPTR